MTLEYEDAHPQAKTEIAVHYGDIAMPEPSWTIVVMHPRRGSKKIPA